MYGQHIKGNIVAQNIDTDTTKTSLVSHGSTALVVLGLLTVEVSRSHSDTPYTVGLLCTRDWPFAGTPT